jgi:hypothetical protein
MCKPEWYIYRKLVFLLSAILLISLTACQGDTEQLERMPGIDLPLQEMNTDLHLLAPVLENELKIGDLLFFHLFNTSNNIVTLPENYGVHIFKSIDGTWIPVIDEMTNPPGEKRIGANGSETYLFESLILDPNIYSTEPVQIRVVVLGNFLKNNGKLGKETGAYVDVTLTP